MTEQPTDRSVAAALQRVLLPAGLPAIAGWAVATLYEPAGDAVLVGGDFYDWFTLPNGRVLFFLGDVSGKGPLAGALGMSIRKALKGITWVIGDALEALPLLEQALAEEFRDAFATLCMIEITPGSGALRLLLAGHPAPWIRSAGVFREAAAPANGLLGPRLQERWESVDLALAAGDMLVLFSDGLTEARLPDGRLFGEGPLEHFLASLPPGLASYETVLQADAHLRRVAGAPTDDIIVGVLTFAPASHPPLQHTPGAEVLAIRLSPHSTSAGVARRFVLDACRRWQVAADPQSAAQSIASELVTNAVLHARTDMELRLSNEDRRLRIEVRDFSPTMPSLRSAGSTTADAYLEHGRGLELVRLLGADLGVTPSHHGKAVWAALPL